MAKKTPKKYRQAKKAAKPAAKTAFPGKVKAVRRDPMAKYSAEDKQIFEEIKKESKGRYITDDKGNKIQVKPTETAKERIARERAEAMRKFREEVDTDKQAARDERMAKKRQAAIEKQKADKAARAGKPAPTLQQTAPTVKSQTTKAPAKKAAVKKAAAKPAAVSAPAKKTAPAKKAAVKKAATKPTVYSITDVQPEKATKGAKKAKFIQKKTKAPVAKKTTTTPKTSGTVAVRPKGTVATKAKGKEVVSTRGTAKPVVSAANKKVNKYGKFAKQFAKGAALTALGAEAVSLAKGSIYRDVKEIDRLETKLAKLQGKKSPNSTALGRLNQLRKGTAANLANFADLATFGAVGQTRRERMDELNKLITKEKKTKGSAKGSTKTGPLGNYAMSTGKVQSSAGSSVTKPSTGGSGTTPSGGGSTTKVTPGGTYVVKRGDTLSGIAKAAGVSLAEIRAANKKFAKNPKYKQGNMIWSGTTVKIPKKK
jgi:LysM repeat protein